MTHNRDDTWSVEEVELMRKLWKLGHSYSEISDALCLKFPTARAWNRSVIAGKIHRLSRIAADKQEWKRADSSINRIYSTSDKSIKVDRMGWPLEPFRGELMPVKKESDIPCPEPKNLTMLECFELDHNWCRYPTDIEGKTHLFCAHKVPVLEKYCDHHKDISSTKVREPDTRWLDHAGALKGKDQVLIVDAGTIINTLGAEVVEGLRDLINEEEET